MYKALRHQLTRAGIGWRRLPLALALGVSLGSVADAATIDLSVVDGNGTPITTGFKWLVEEDRTVPVTEGVSNPDSLSFQMHMSHAPVMAQGSTPVPNAGVESISFDELNTNSDGRYFISVLPNAGYAMNGAAVSLDGNGNATAEIVVHENPIPTAQIAVYVFEDNHSINGAPDLPAERGLGGPSQPFHVLLFDAGGQYGAAGGQVTQDAFGNPLGSTYLPNGDVDQLAPDGFALHTDENGVLLIKNLPPAKYGVQVVPPPGKGWSQTSTIEGSKTIDAWVKANEPSYFAEFGPPGPHVFVGFVKTFDCLNAPTAANCEDDQGTALIDPVNNGATVSGTITNSHLSRSPDFAFYSGHPFPACRIGVNLNGQGGPAIYSQPCDDDSGFQIDNVPPGDYNLAVWDDNLDVVIAQYNFTVTGTGNNAQCSTPDGLCDLGEVPVFNWFARVESSVFFDTDGDGYRDCTTVDCDDPSVDEIGLGADVSAVNLRFRDGRIYQSFPVDGSGEAPFDEVFPFFHWLVAEVDFATMKATGATFTIDAGGAVPAGETLNAQKQVCTTSMKAAGDCVDGDGNPRNVGDSMVNKNTGNAFSRTDTGPVLTQAFQGFLGQTVRMEFGKSTYGAGENGGVSGMVFYAITRAEDDPRYAAAEEWEPGVPRVQVALYEDRLPNLLGDGIIDDRDGSGDVTLADVDNYPLGWAEGGAKGPEDVDHNSNGTFDKGDAIRVTWTDSWDDSVPYGCQGANNMKTRTANGTLVDVADDLCFDGLRNFNQARPGVFDGGWAFGGFGAPASTANQSHPTELNPEAHLLPGMYIAQHAVPPGYEVVKEEDRNVDFGDEYSATTLKLPPNCVGDGRVVPPLMSHVTADGSGETAQLLAGYDPVEFAAPYAGDTRPLCDRKLVRLGATQNAAIDFFLMTDAPKAAHVVGGVINDLGNEFDPNAPTFGEKFAPPWVPVSFRDWAGNEITRTYTDEFGKFNAMLPSTYSVNVASPSGVAPNMIQACMNDAGDGLVPDPLFNKQYSQFCYVFQYMPGGTTYLDTPVVPLAAFTGAGNPLDCEVQDDHPRIAWVRNTNSTGGVAANSGPFIDASENNANKRRLRIRSVGKVKVPNPDYDGSNNRLVERDYRFGGGNNPGTVVLKGLNGQQDRQLDIQNWSNNTVNAIVPKDMAPGAYELVLTRGNGNQTNVGVTVQIGPFAKAVHVVSPSNSATATPIQNAIDAAAPGDLILVKPGNYREMPIMYKPVKLQGQGAGSVVINARKSPASKLQAWRDKVNTLVDNNQITLLDGQEQGWAAGDNEPVLFFDAEGAGVFVAGKRNGSTRFLKSHGARIDGFTITGADHGGGVFANGWAKWLTVSNNRIESNQGTWGGGVRFGHSVIDGEQKDAQNDFAYIHHNHIAQNGNLNGAGAGISLYTGTDRYEVAENFICGNFASTHGGGIGHEGLSDNGLIESNTIVFNQSFKQTFNVDGGGIYISGGLPPAGESLSAGSGNVSILANLIQGNNAGAGDGAGIALDRVNGTDVDDNPNNVGQWHLIRVFNNMIVNNVAGNAGGGVSLRDSIRTQFVNNTIANNDSTATVGTAFAQPNVSTKQPAGLVSRHNRPALEAAIGNVNAPFKKGFSNPWPLKNNIIAHNRSFHFEANAGFDPAGDLSDPTNQPFYLHPRVDATFQEAPVYDDLAVIGGGNMAPRYTVFSEGYTGAGANNTTNVVMGPGDALDFVLDVPNGNRNQTIQQPETTVQVAVAADEGGNFIEVRYGPLSLKSSGDYHLAGESSVAYDAGQANVGPAIVRNWDFDFEPRERPDIGADELH